MYNIMDFLKHSFMLTIGLLFYLRTVSAITVFTYNYMPCSEESEMEIMCTDDTKPASELNVFKSGLFAVTNCSSEYDRLTVVHCENTTLLMKVKPVNSSDNGVWDCLGSTSPGFTVENEAFPHEANISIQDRDVICEACGSNKTDIKIYEGTSDISDSGSVERIIGEPCTIDGWNGTYIERRIYRTPEKHKNAIKYGCIFGLKSESFENCELEQITVTKDGVPGCYEGCISGCVVGVLAVTLGVVIAVFAGAIRISRNTCRNHQTEQRSDTSEQDRRLLPSDKNNKICCYCGDHQCCFCCI